METPEESGAGYPEEQPSEMDDTPGRRDPEQDPSGGDEERAPDNEDGTATGNPNAAGASEAGAIRSARIAMSSRGGPSRSLSVASATESTSCCASPRAQPEMTSMRSSGVHTRCGAPASVTPSV